MKAYFEESVYFSNPRKTYGRYPQALTSILNLHESAKAYTIISQWDGYLSLIHI